MLFNSLQFTVFFPVIFAIYWLANKNLRLQNVILLLASYFFYACWDWRFLFLLAFSTLLDYFTGIKIAEAENRKAKKFWLWTSIGINLGFLGIFKYYNFFVESFASGLSAVGIQSHLSTLQLILPIGISFYTFHGLSYVIDIYNDRIKPEKNLIDYSLFVGFFPLLVAGPIERATHLLPQIKARRDFNYDNAVSGLRQILWGFFKKMVIADNCAIYVNAVFNDGADYSSGAHAIAAILFTVQIYCDFSGYSDIALGTARLLGIDLLRNFAFPFYSRDIAEFWRRWHISLSSWFRDYLYIPLGGSKGSTLRKVRNILVIFLVSGFWHGAKWTFVIWGLLNALYIIPSVIFKTNRNHLDIVAQGRLFATPKEMFQIGVTFALTVFAFIFFRADNIGAAYQYVSQLFARGGIALEVMPEFIVLLCFFIVVEWLGRENEFAIEKLGFSQPKIARIGFYYMILLAIFLFSGSGREFIYFQF